MIDAADLRTFKQFAEECPAFSVNSLRHMYAHRFENGAEEYQVFTKIRNRRMVDVPKFNRLLEAKRQSKTN